MRNSSRVSGPCHFPRTLPVPYETFWRFWDNSIRQGSPDYAAWVSELAKLKRQSSEEGIPLSHLQWRWIFDDVVEHPGITLQMAAIRILSLHVALANSQRPEACRIGPLSGLSVYTMFSVIVNAATFILVAASISFLAARRREFVSHWILWGPWITLLAFHPATYAEPQYLFPSQPGLVIMAVAALAR